MPTELRHCPSRRSTTRRQHGFILTLTLILAFTVLVIGSVVFLVRIRNHVFVKSGENVIFDSAATPIAFGRAKTFDMCEAPQLVCKDPDNGLVPIVGVRPDRFTSRNQVFYTGADCTGDTYLAPPAVPPELAGVWPAEQPVGYLNGSLLVDGTPMRVVYGVGAPPGFDFATMLPTGPGLLYRSTTATPSTVLIASVWTSMAPDCAPDPLPGTGGSGATVAAEQKISDTEGNFTGTLSNNAAFGSSVTGLGDLDNDGVPDIAVGMPSDPGAGTGQGAVWILFLNADGTVKSHLKVTDGEGVGFDGTLSDNDAFGTGVAGIGDLDDDGVEDLAVGAINDPGGGTGRGAVWILFLNTNGTVKDYLKIADNAGVGFDGTLADNDAFGTSLAGLGDLDGDGIEDLAVGAPGDDGAGSNRGAVWILFLDTDGTVDGYEKIGDASGDFTGTLDNSDAFGAAVAALGDVNVDGVTDLAIGAPNDDDGATDGGAIWIVFLDTDGSADDTTPQQKITEGVGGFAGAIDNTDAFGFSVAGPGDLSGDGIPDVIVGAPLDDDPLPEHGALWVLFLDTDGTVLGVQKISETSGGFGGQLDNQDQLGTSVAAIGDLDGDGGVELATGAPEDDDGGSNRGAVWILFLGGGGLPPDQLCEEVGPLDLILVPAVEVEESPGTNVLEQYTAPFYILPSTLEFSPAAPEGAVLQAPSIVTPGSPTAFPAAGPESAAPLAEDAAGPTDAGDDLDQPPASPESGPPPS